MFAPEWYGNAATNEGTWCSCNGLHVHLSRWSPPNDFNMLQPSVRTKYKRTWVLTITESDVWKPFAEPIVDQILLFNMMIDRARRIAETILEWAVSHYAEGGA